jgi:hypothetical protein
MKRLVSCLSMVFLVACSGGKKGQTTEAATETPATASTTGASAAPEVDFMIKTADMALKQKNEIEAVATLQTLRAEPTLNVDQKLAVQEMMARAQANLAARAAAGDQQAQAALRMMQMNPH